MIADCPPPIVTYSFYSDSLDNLLDGYSLQSPDGSCWWIPFLVDWNDWQRQAPTHFTTRALYQSEGVAERTAEYHNIEPNGRHLVSLMSPRDVGKTVWLRAPGGEWIEAVNVDAVQQVHAYFHIVNAESAIEVSWQLAEQLGMLDQTSHAGLYGLEVCVADSPEVCEHSTPVDYTEWFLNSIDE